MTGYKDQNSKENYWDFTLKNGTLKTIDHNVSDQQRAIIATFLQRGSVPQAPGIGNQWSELLTGDVQPQDVNAQIRDSIIQFTGGVKYLPKYSMKDGKLLVEVKQV